MPSVLQRGSTCKHQGRSAPLWSWPSYKHGGPALVHALSDRADCGPLKEGVPMLGPLPLTINDLVDRIMYCLPLQVQILLHALWQNVPEQVQVVTPRATDDGDPVPAKARL